MRLKDKTAIVTGAGKGIGAAIARRFAHEGCAVAVNYARDEAAARQVVHDIEQAGGKAVAVQADVGDPAGMPALFDAAEAAFGPVDLLVNNAGMMRLSPVADATDADIEDHCSINLAGTFRGMREGAKRLRDGGRIISVSSSVVGFYQPGYGLYAATTCRYRAPRAPYSCARAWPRPAFHCRGIGYRGSVKRLSRRWVRRRTYTGSPAE
ncbi:MULTISPECIES: SDR family NAD(P)-dependent oxidoreductase [Sinorhizobium]|uniref:SDR family NAD(P)-dependent oxidoreductase n=1 Tax=Sinorhizobium TaxID=28105 RepID=UPI001F36F713|nr:MULTISPECIES: SDR family NAD(P)-dependent oxidoreductase [Sinorhizobium]